LNSIRRQEYPATEVIIVDGASRDGTLAVAERYRDIVKVVVSERDSGQPEAVTKGLRLATGQITHWHASDDIVLPNAFQRVNREFNDHPDIDLVFSDGFGFDSRRTSRHDTARWITFDASLAFFGRFQSDCAYWRHPISRAGLPLDDGKPLCCDEDFFLKIWAGHKAKWINQPLGAMRSREGQLCRVLDKGRVNTDRRDTRQQVVERLGLDDRGMSSLRKRTLCRYLLGHRVGPRGFSLARFLVRKITFDQGRKREAEWFFGEWLQVSVEDPGAGRPVRVPWHRRAGEA
jgi:glycosyltransferase involved in cell wall biosynthesis